MGTPEIIPPFDAELNEILIKVDDAFLTKQLKNYVKFLRNQMKEEDGLLIDEREYSDKEVLEKVKKRSEFFAKTLEHLKKFDAYSKMNDAAKDIIRHYIWVTIKTFNGSQDQFNVAVEDIVKVVVQIESESTKYIKHYSNSTSQQIGLLTQDLDKPFEAQEDCKKFGAIKLQVQPEEILDFLSMKTIENLVLDHLLSHTITFINRYLAEIKEEEDTFTQVEKLLYLEKIIYKIIDTLRKKFSKYEVTTMDTLRFRDLQETCKTLDKNIETSMTEFKKNFIEDMIKFGVSNCGYSQSSLGVLYNSIKKYIQYIVQQEIGKAGAPVLLEDVVKATNTMPIIVGLMKVYKREKSNIEIIEQIISDIWAGKHRNLGMPVANSDANVDDPEKLPTADGRTSAIVHTTPENKRWYRKIIH